MRIEGYLPNYREGINAGGLDYSNGALRWVKDGGVVSVIAVHSSTAQSYSIILDTDLNTGAGFTGKSGSQGTVSKPPTVAFMWILRFI